MYVMDKEKHKVNIFTGGCPNKEGPCKEDEE